MNVLFNDISIIICENLWQVIERHWEPRLSNTLTTSSIWHQTIRTSGALCFNWINIIKFFPNITSQGISLIDSEDFLQQWQSNLAKKLNTGLSQQWLYRFFLMSPGSFKWPIVMGWRPSSCFVRLQLLLKKYRVNLYQIWYVALQRKKTLIVNFMTPIPKGPNLGIKNVEFVYFIKNSLLYSRT